MEAQKFRNNYYAEYFNMFFPKKWFNRCHGKPFHFTELIVLDPESIQEVTFGSRKNSPQRAQLNDANSKSDPC